MIPHRPYIHSATQCSIKEHGSCAAPKCALDHNRGLITNGSATISPVNILGQQPKSSDPKNVILDSSPQGGTMSVPKHDNDHDQIDKIAILPTTDEIICLKPTFMPEKTANLSAKQLLDLHFRQLRYDSTEEIVDACYDAFQRVIWGKIFSHRLETPGGIRYSLFSEVSFEACQYHHQDGALFKLSFDCPPPLRRFALLKSDVFEPGMLCSLLAVHKGTNEVNVIHFEVRERQPSDLKTSVADNRASVQLAMAEKNDRLKVQQATYYAKGLILADFFLVNLPSVLPAGFIPVLRQLQCYHRDKNFPFKEAIVLPSSNTEVQIPPPQYAIKSDFKYNYSCLRNETTVASDQEMVFSPMQDGKPDNTVVESLLQHTTLDGGQATALYENLSRRLALCQGPPGTGKTFLGVAEAKVILNSQHLNSHEHQDKPIIVICMTNHALDDFVQSLISNGIKEVVRLGGQSTNEWILDYSLQKVIGGRKVSEQDRQTLKKLAKQNYTLTKLGTEWADELSGSPSFRLLHDHLATHEPDILAELERLDANTEISRELRLLKKSSAARAFDYWLQGGDLKGLACLLDEGLTNGSSSSSLSSPIRGMQYNTGRWSQAGIDHEGTENSYKTSETSQSELAYSQALQKALEEFSRRCAVNKDTHRLWLLSLADREALVASWIKDLDEFALCNAFADLHLRHQSIRQIRWDHMHVADAQRIREVGVKVVAVTASGAAHKWQLLKALEPETCIIEEASELSEPFTIAGLVPSLQHVIKIGDPLQLRPHIRSRILSTEHDSRYRLDESLFERLMQKMPYSKLDVQRRAHPELANLLRAGCYPFLNDHSKTLAYPTIPGFQHRMFWLDHNRVEDHPDPGSALAKSCSNKYEARFIVEAIKYLVQHQGVSMTQITVLTPYNGQVAQIAKYLQGFCKVLLNDSDRESLIVMGLLPEMDLLLDPSASKDVRLDSLVRLTTIDNYQGEENDIIFFSAVRSNPDNKLGFLANQNRVNVAISRARHAFYIVGNSSTLFGKGTGWDPVIEVFKTQQRIGTCMPIAPCAKHAVQVHVVVDVDHPTNFQALPICQTLCGTILSCGHQCTAACHADEMHVDGRLKCSQPCNKTLPCGHRCGNLCHEDCGPCSVTTESVVLDCGHKANVPCSKDASKLQCNVVVLVYPGVCGHIRIKHCSTGLAPCLEKCTKPYPCGHQCQSTCSDCEHTGCDQVCGAKLDCGHVCRSPCHHGTEGPCPPCNQPCRKRCVHGRCTRTCSEVCKPCTKAPVASHCTHQSSALLCCLPGSRLPCSEPCTLPAPCGIHTCQGLCGEDCPEICDICSGQPRRDGLFALPCKCVFDVSELDAHFQMDKIYDIDGITITKINVTSLPDKNCLQCPKCGNSIIGSRRFALSHQINDHNDIVGSLLMTLGRQLWKFMSSVNHEQLELPQHLVRSCTKIRPGPLAIKNNQETVTQALVSIRSIRKEAERFQIEVQSIQDAILAYSASLIPAHNEAVTPQGLPLARPYLPYGLRVERVLIRCDILIFKFLLDLHTNVKARGQLDNHLTVFLQVMQSNMNATLDRHIQNLPQLITQCQVMQLKRLEVEFLIQRVCIVGLIRRLGCQTESTTSHIERAVELCDSHRSAAQLRYLVTNADRAIKENTESVKLDDALNGPKDTAQAAAQMFWRKLATFEPGKLTTCASGHFYCGATFSHCPECG